MTQLHRYGQDILSWENATDTTIYKTVQMFGEILSNEPRFL